MTRFAGILLVDRRGWLLLQERDEFPVLAPEKWSLCGGHVEAGESFEQAAYRELVEETGVLLAPGTLRLWRELDVVHDGHDPADRMAVFAAPVDLADDDIVLGEGRQIVFVEPGEAQRLDLSGAASMILPAFLDSDLYANMTP